MKTILRSVFPAILFAFGCHSKEMSLEELKKANWSKLDKGVEYLNLEKGRINPDDSIRLTAKGFWGTNTTIPLEVYNEIQPFLNSILSQLLISRLKESKHGYLKVNLLELSRPPLMTAFAYLRNNTDSTDLAKGIEMIRSIDGVTAVTFISKEMAAEKYLADGNPDWKEFTDFNPLPASLELSFDPNEISEQNYESIISQIKDKIPNISDVNFPKNRYQKFEGNYYILEYKRS